MTATNMCSDFNGFWCGSPLRVDLSKKNETILYPSTPLTQTNIHKSYIYFESKYNNDIKEFEY